MAERLCVRIFLLAHAQHNISCLAECKIKVLSLTLFFEPLSQPGGTPLESDVSAQPNTGDAVILRGALAGVIPNP
jgi:hypothetical protein